MNKTHSLFCFYDAAAPSLICSKVPRWRTVTAAVPVAANKVVVEPTNVSIAILADATMMKYTHIMVISTAHSCL